MTESNIQSGDVPAPGRGWIRDNVLLVIALVLPLLVVLIFLVMTIVPRLTVAAPRYDLAMSATGSWDQGSRHSLTFSVRDNRIVADFRPPGPNSSALRQTLYLFDHATLDVREVPVTVPGDLADGESRTIVVDALAARPVVAQMRAPDGYEFSLRTSNSPGLVGEVFGMRHYDQHGSIRNGGRVISIALPGSYSYSVTAVGWLGTDERRQ